MSTHPFHKSKFSFHDLPIRYHDRRPYSYSHLVTNGNKFKSSKFSSKPYPINTNTRLNRSNSFSSDYPHSPKYNNCYYSRYIHQGLHHELDRDLNQPKPRIHDTVDDNVIYVDEVYDEAAEIMYSPLHKSSHYTEKESQIDANIPPHYAKQQYIDPNEDLSHSDCKQQDHFFFDRISGNLYCNGTQLSFIPLMPQVSMPLSDNGYFHNHDEIELITFEESNDKSPKDCMTSSDQKKLNGEAVDFQHKTS